MNIPTDALVDLTSLDAVTEYLIQEQGMSRGEACTEALRICPAHMVNRGWRAMSLVDQLEASGEITLLEPRQRSRRT